MSKEYSMKYMQENLAYKHVLREYAVRHILEPLKRYPTTISDTIFSIILQRLEELYLLTVRFPEIVSPDSNRLDILRAIADQFEFTIRTDADIEEQVSILESVIEVYKKRGSIDSIENMWRYYGGNLPKDIKVKIPSYDIFRYNISTWSGAHRLQDKDTHRPGVYEVVLHNSNYDIPDLKEFMLKELVAAGNRVIFTNSVYDLLVGENSAYKYDVQEELLKCIEMLVSMDSIHGFTWSKYSKMSMSGRDSTWSGNYTLSAEVLKYLYVAQPISVLDYEAMTDIINTWVITPDNVIDVREDYMEYTQEIQYRYLVSYTPEIDDTSTERHLYDEHGNLVTSSYPGYFILAESLLGSEVI